MNISIFDFAVRDGRIWYDDPYIDGKRFGKFIAFTSDTFEGSCPFNTGVLRDKWFKGYLAVQQPNDVVEYRGWLFGVYEVMINQGEDSGKD